MKISLYVFAAGAAAAVAGWLILSWSAAPVVPELAVAQPSPAAPASARPVAEVSSARPASRKAAMASTKDFSPTVAAIEAMPREGEREQAVRALAREWGAEDPVAAENWAAGLENESEREAALMHVALVWVETDPAAAMEMARWRQLPPGVVGALAQRWGQQDFPAALAWAEQLESDAEREAALGRICLAQAEADPAQAAELVATRLGAGPVQAEAAMAVLYQWLRRDPDAAAEWVARFPAGAFRERAENEVRGYLTQRAAAPGAGAQN